MSNTPSVTRSFIPAKAVGTMSISKDEVGAYADLANIGISFDSADIAKMSEWVAAGDAAPVAPLTSPSITTPVQFLQNWLPGFVRVITRARKIDELVGISTVGSWEDEEIVQPVLELSGNAVPYGDYTNVPLSSWNLNYERRSVVRFEEGLQVGILENARSSRVRADTSAQKRQAASEALEIQRNSVGFFGYNNGANRTYGMLNDPELPAYVNAPNGAGGQSEWNTKTFLEITADIRSSLEALRVSSGDNIDPSSDAIVMGVAMSAVGALTVTSDFGNSVRQWLNESYPNVRIVSVPEFDAANGGDNVVYFYADTVADSGTDDQATFIQVVPAKFQSIGVEQKAKSYLEDYSNATAGIMLKRPYATYRLSGV